MITSRPPSELLLKDVQRFGQRTQQASLTTSAAISFMHGGMANTTRRGAIHVQPTATSRRRQALGRGSRRVGMGRPVNVVKTIWVMFKLTGVHYWVMFK